MVGEVAIRTRGSHAPTIGTGSCRRWYSLSRITVNVRLLAFSGGPVSSRRARRGSPSFRAGTFHQLQTRLCKPLLPCPSSFHQSEPYRRLFLETFASRVEGAFREPALMAELLDRNAAVLLAGDSLGPLLPFRLVADCPMTVSLMTQLYSFTDTPGRAVHETLTTTSTRRVPRWNGADDTRSEAHAGASAFVICQPLLFPCIRKY
jgi:hypothetical protein